MSVFERAKAGLGLRHNIGVMLGALLILGMGEELWMRFMPKYLEALGAGAVVIGAYGALKDLLDALYPYPGGWLTDRLGSKRALILFALIAAAGYAIYFFGPSWEWVLVGTVFVMAWSSFTLPTIFTVIGDNLPSNSRAIGFGVQSILKRVPTLVAPLAGGALIAVYGLRYGVQIGVAVTILLSIATAVFVAQFYRERDLTHADRRNFFSVWRVLDPGLKRLLLSDILIRWAEGLPKVFIILYVMNVLHFSAIDFGLLTGIQIAVSILVYIPIAKMSDRMNRKPFVLLTFAFFVAFPLVLINAHHFALLVAAFALAGLREIGEPARKALIVDLATQTMIGRSVGMYYLARGVGVFPAALVGGWLWLWHPAAPFYLAGIVGLLGLLLYAAAPATEPAVR